MTGGLLALLFVGVMLWTLRGPQFPIRDRAPEVKRILVISDSLSEGMGEVSDIGRTWPQVMARSLRKEYGLDALSGGSWIPAGLNGSGFTFAAGKAGRGASSATDEIGIPGSMRGGPITFRVAGYERALITVNATRPGVTYTVRTGTGTRRQTSRRAGVNQFRIPVTDETVEVTPDDGGQVLGVLAESGTPGSGLSVYNLSWSGSGTNDWLRWIDQGDLMDMVRQIDPDLVILSLGGNDYWAPDSDAARFDAHLRRIHDAVAAAAPDARWILGTQPVPGRELAENWEAFQQVTVRYAEELNAPVIDLASDMPSVRNTARLYSADRIHLTDEGHAWIAALAVLAVHELNGR